MPESQAEETAITNSGEQPADNSADMTKSEAWVTVTEQEARWHPLYGIGGWMILLTIGLFLSMFQAITVAIQDFKLLNSSDFPTSVTLLIGVEAWGNLLIVGLLAVCFIFVVTKNRRFSGLYFALVCLFPIFNLADSIATNLVFNNLGYYSPIWDPDTAQNVIIGMVVAVIWGSYVKVSRRVNVTFLHRVEEQDIHYVRNEATASYTNNDG